MAAGPQGKALKKEEGLDSGLDSGFDAGFDAGFDKKWQDFPDYIIGITKEIWEDRQICLLYTSPSPRDLSTSRMPSSA